MGQAIARIDALVRRCEGGAWTVLACCAALIPWLGIEPPMAGPVGEGLQLLDALVVGCMIAACVAQIARIVRAPLGEHVVIRTASWLLLLALLLIAGRLTWILATAGDVHMTLTMAIALLLLSGSVVLHAVGRVVYRSCA